MITKDQVMPLLLEACPSFRQIRDEPCRTCGEEGLYIVLGEFADHLLALHQQHQTEAFPAIAHVIERLHVEGDRYVREAATIGLLEGIQNIWGNNRVDPEQFFPYLMPESAKWWCSLSKFWSGQSRFVGEGL